MLEQEALAKILSGKYTVRCSAGTEVYSVTYASGCPLGAISSPQCPMKYSQAASPRTQSAKSLGISNHYSILTTSEAGADKEIMTPRSSQVMMQYYCSVDYYVVHSICYYNKNNRQRCIYCGVSWFVFLLPSLHPVVPFHSSKSWHCGNARTRPRLLQHPGADHHDVLSGTHCPTAKDKRYSVRSDCCEEERHQNMCYPFTSEMFNVLLFKTKAEGPGPHQHDNWLVE